MLPASSWIFNVTFMVNDPVAGSGGGGSMLQLKDGLEKTGPDVVWVFGLPVTPHVQSYAVILPGALEVLPLKVQSSAVPPLITAHVSVTSLPVTPKLAVATVARVSEMLAVALAPPNEPWMVAVVGVVTTWVNTLKLALVLPAITITIAGTTAVASLERVMDAPVLGAGPVKVAVAVTLEPPTVVDGLTVSEASRSPCETVSIAD